MGTKDTDHDAMACSVDLPSGVLSPAVLEFFDAEIMQVLGSRHALDEWARHPITNAPIAGERLEGWEEMLAICTQAHAALGLPAFVGWDVTMSDQGPVLIEGNSAWGHTSSQVSQNTPLGLTPFVACYIANLEAKGSATHGS